MVDNAVKKELYKFLIVILIILVVLIAFISYISYPLLTGKKIILATQPVDPFDMFRGQYLTIGYEISSIPSVKNAQVGDTIYVGLEEDENGTSRYKSASLSMPNKEELFIKGKAIYIDQNILRVEYGIENYFFERHAQFQTMGIQVEAKVSSSGTARIVQLLQNGKPLEINYQNITLTS